MADRTSQGELFSDAPEAGVIAINGRCQVRTADGHRAVTVAGVPVAHYAAGDAMAEAQAMVSLVDQGWADQNDVARAFGRSARTVRRCQRRFEAGGLAALGRKPGYPKGRSRMRASRLSLVRKWKASGTSNREIARRLGVNEKAVRKLLARLGFKSEVPSQQPLPLSASTLPPADPNLSAPTASTTPTPASSQADPRNAGAASAAAGADPNVSATLAEAEELAVSADTNPLDRSGDRLLAYLGLLNDAVPMFAPGKRLPCAGVLLALPALVQSGVVECAREVYGCIGPAFFGLRTTMVALVLMALLRIRRPENLKEHPPVDLGRVLGLDRAPEVKTLRR